MEYLEKFRGKVDIYFYMENIYLNQQCSNKKEK